MEFASEFVIKAAQLRAKITEIPITLWPDKRGRPPHLRSFRDGWRHLRFMLLYAPNWLFLLPGAALVIVGLALVFWLLPGPRTVTPRITLDIHTMILGVMFTLLKARRSSRLAHLPKSSATPSASIAKILVRCAARSPMCDSKPGCFLEAASF